MDTPRNLEDRITLKLVSEITGISYSTIRSHADKGILYTTYAGKKMRVVTLEELISYWYWASHNPRMVMYPTSTIEGRINFFIYGIWT